MFAVFMCIFLLLFAFPLKIPTLHSIYAVLKKKGQVTHLMTEALFVLVVLNGCLEEVAPLLVVRLVQLLAAVAPGHAVAPRAVLQ